MYKALILDLDGTVGPIGTDGSDISEDARDAVLRGRRLGKKIACATGRGWPKAGPVVKKLGIIDPCVIEGGSCIIDPTTEEILWEVTLDQKQTLRILAMLADMATDRVLVKTTSDKSLLPVVQCSNPDGSNRIIYLLGANEEMANKIEKVINETDFAVAHKTAPSWYGDNLTDVHITNPGGTKEHAIEKWQEMVGVKKAETIGLGDSENDLPLFRSVGLKIAVGNAHKNLKVKADQTVSVHNNGALEEVISQFLIA